MNQLKIEEHSKDWKKLSFGDLAYNISKRVDPATTHETIYIGLEHIEPRQLRINSYGSPSEVIGQKLLFDNGDIIFGKRRAYQRKAAVASFPGICSAHAMVLRENNHHIVPGFLIHLIHTDVFMNTAIKISEGSLSPTIKWKTLADQNFIIPPKEVQEKLLKSLEKIELIENLILENLTCLDNLLTAYKAEYMPINGFSEIDNERYISDFLTESSIPGSTGETAKKITIKLYGLGAVAKDNSIGSVNTKYFLRKPGQFIYSKLDFLNGAFAVIPEELEGYESTSDLPSFDVSQELLSSWLFHFVNRPEYYGSFTHSAKGGRKAKRISPKAFLASKFPYFDIEIQKKHLSTIDTIIHQKKILEEKQKIMFRLRETVLIGAK